MKRSKRMISILTASLLALNGMGAVIGASSEGSGYEMLSKAWGDPKYSNYDYVIDQQINKPYFKFRVTNEPVSINGEWTNFPLDLKNKNGKVVAHISPDSRKLQELADGMLDFSDLQKRNYYSYLAENNISLDQITDVRIHLDDDKQNFNMSEFQAIGSGRLEKGTEDDGRTFYKMDLNGQYSYSYLDTCYEKVGEYTLPANCFHMDICGWYGQSNDDTSGLYVFNSGVTSEERVCIIGDPWMLRDRAGENITYETAPGEYDATFKGTYFWTSQGNLKVRDYETKYIKVKAPFKAVFPQFFDGSIPAFCFNDALEADYHAPDGNTYHIDLNGDASVSRFKMMIICGGMIQVIYPDPDGNIEFWTTPELKDTTMLCSIDTPYHRNDGYIPENSYTTVFSRKKVLYNIDFDFPENGWAIYNIPEGDYTLEISSDSPLSKKYRVKDPKIHISNTRDLQSRDFEIEERPPESSSKKDTSSSKVTSSSSKKPASSSSKAATTVSKPKKSSSSKAATASSESRKSSSSKATTTSSKKSGGSSSSKASKPSNNKILKGDANCDGSVNVTDLGVTAAHIKGIKALSGNGLKNANVNSDKQVDVTDISMIASHIKGIKPLK